MRKLLGDAMDVLERKIDLLEKKGWFTGVEHRREALDRLLPTIRATKDPIQRELYLSTVAERAKVSVDVLVEEMKRTASRFDGSPPSSGTAPQARPQSRTAPAPHRPSASGHGDERSLLRAMLMQRDWVERAVQDGVTAEWFDHEQYREIASALLAGQGDELPGALSTDAALTWSELKESLGQLDPTATGDLYEASRESLEARPQFREFDKLIRAIERASAEAKDTLIRERELRRAALSKKYPTAWKRWYARRGIK